MASQPPRRGVARRWSSACAILRGLRESGSLRSLPMTWVAEKQERYAGTVASPSGGLDRRSGMSETGDLLQDSARRLFAGHCDQNLVARAEAGAWPEALWHAIEEAGFAAALVPEAAGGSGVGMADALGVLRVAGGSCAPVPLAESMVANWLLATSGLG